MQGRLSPPVGDHMQEFPINWKQEFDHVSSLGLFGVEWLITKNNFLDNPIVRDPSIQDKFPIVSVCLDVLVDSRIANSEFLNSTLKPVCDLGLRRLTIPILDDSDLKDDKKRRTFCSLIQDFGKKYPDIIFSFEAELDRYKLEEIVSLCDNFRVTYDTGNATSCGFNHAEYISFFNDRINNVHLKDRTFDARSVYPFTGDTDFSSIFKTLKNFDYSESFIIQTARSNISEPETISKHKKMFEELYCLI